MEKLMNFNDARKYLRTSRATLYRLIYNKKIPAFKVGGQWRFKVERLERWMEGSENVTKKR